MTNIYMRQYTYLRLTCGRVAGGRGCTGCLSGISPRWTARWWPWPPPTAAPTATTSSLGCWLRGLLTHVDCLQHRLLCKQGHLLLTCQQYLYCYVKICRIRRLWIGTVYTVYHVHCVLIKTHAETKFDCFLFCLRLLTCVALGSFAQVKNKLHHPDASLLYSNFFLYQTLRLAYVQLIEHSQKNRGEKNQPAALWLLSPLCPVNYFRSSLYTFKVVSH